MAAVRLYWDLDSTTLEPAFDLSREEGFRVRSIAMYGPAEDPLYAVLWYQEPGPRQFLRANLSGTELLAYASGNPEPLRRPSLVTGTGGGTSARWSLVLENWSPRSRKSPGRAPSMTWAMPWATFRTHVHTLPAGYYVRSADAVGTRNTEDGQALNFVATIWPCEDDEPWHLSGVRVDDEVEDPGELSGFTLWHQTAAIKRMSAQAAPWFVTSIPAANGHRPQVFSLWNDRVFHPWPEDDPFRPRQHFKITAGTAANIDGVFQDVFGSGIVVPLAIGAAGPDLASARFQITWVPIRHPEGLPRRFLRDGPGDGRTVIQQALTRVRPAVTQVAHAASPYRELEVRPGHVFLQPVAPPAPDVLGAPVASFRDLGPAGDGPGYSTGGDLPTPTLGPAAPSINWHRFDLVMRDHFMREGARAAQLCVLRNGRLVFARAYTQAEEGYPVTRLHHRFRIGSFSKAMTATWLVAQIRASGGLNHTLASALGVSPVLPALQEATIAEAMRHATGLNADDPWLASNIVTQYANGAASSQDIDPADDAVFEQPGTMREWYDRFDVATAAPDAPGTAKSYNNWVFACLGEALSAALRPGSFELVHEAVAELMTQRGSHFLNSDVRAGSNYSLARHRGEVLYHDVPLVRRNEYRNLASDLEGPWTSRPYNFPIELVGAAGGWSMSAVDVARFLRGLTLRPGIEPIISADDLTALSQTLAPPFDQQGLAWVVGTVPWEDAVTGSGSRAVIWHNGGLDGATSLAFHLFDRNNPADTISMVVLRNLAPGPLYMDPDGLALLRVAQEIELEGGWPAGDLFHAV